jgi:hypothetical protein
MNNKTGKVNDKTRKVNAKVFNPNNEISKRAENICAVG